MLKLEKRIAWVTGGGRGIGRAIALALAADGADVAVSSRSADELETVSAELRKLGRRALPVRPDSMSFDDIRTCANTIQGEFGAIDILVNNAGAGPGCRTPRSFRPSSWTSACSQPA